ncbi:hypothetical protein SARC_08656 [Sphaeroforma arctica JP610]|uniref:Amino acid transporter n=1 Tax=Sphaeroforma arctica JP610 TaxID=667725 RepID=A0A0L0FQ54_9EUKA|nr:hypothetical protein SARC_08656 [Sphaeroforma arctica JP610]KNC78935.1 hypothetical protein SARC_08656 [Sphaeroforma arctica JP610]|eukprot:XP_014152837.1 hypothetical protein SARC_08656 [Sphaeroforma arctica JP610]
MSSIDNDVSDSSNDLQNASFGNKLWTSLRNSSMILWTLVGAFIGIGVGLLLSHFQPSAYITLWLGMPGTLFIRALTLMVVPLVFCSILLGVAGVVDVGGSVGRLSAWTVALYSLTTVVAVIEGLIFVQSFRFAWAVGPEDVSGVTVNPITVEWDLNARVSAIDNNMADDFYYSLATASSVLLLLPGQQVLTNITTLVYNAPQTVSFMMPDLLPTGSVTNFSVYDAAGALAFAVPDGALTIIPSASDTTSSDSPASTGESVSNSFEDLLYMLVPRNALGTFVGLPNNSASLLGLITFALVFAVGLAILKRRNMWKSDVVLDVTRQILDVILLLTNVILKLTPVAVCSLIISAVGSQSLQSLADTMASLGILFATVILAFLFHAFVFMGSLLWGFTRRNIFTHYAGVAPALSLAFASASSASTLPTTMAMAEKIGMSEHISKFVLSLGATINMDGNAVFMPAIVIWLADSAGIPITVVDQIIICIVAALASMGSSPAPGLTPAVILVWGSVFPEYPVPDAIVYVLALDWLLDRCITTVNVAGDTVIARVVDTLNDKQLKLPNESNIELPIDSDNDENVAEDLAEFQSTPSIKK